jgi:prepilin-type N-terminal cleavage/methylation domain-containing protein
MRYKKGFTLIGLLMAISIIGVLALIGLRVYNVDQQEKTKSTIIQERAKNILVQANAENIQSLIQAELADRDINRDDAVNIAQNAGLYNPFNEVVMNTSKWFPENANIPGEIQITLLEGIFYIQGYGDDGLLPDILTVQR